MGVENYAEKNKIMKCGYSDKTLRELESEGWERIYSFHSRIKEQWDMACDKVEGILLIGGDGSSGKGDWEVILAMGDNKSERKDGVTYIYKRKTDKRKEWEKRRDINR